MGKKRTDFNKGALSAEEIIAIDDRGVGYYENLLPLRFLDPTLTADTGKKPETKATPKRGPRVEGE